MSMSANFDELSTNYLRAQLASDRREAIRLLVEEGFQRVLSDLLDFEGFDVFFLGEDVPVTSLVDKIDAAQPDLVVLSMTMTFHQDALRRSAAAIRRAHPSLPIAGGGHAFGWCPELAGELSLAMAGTDARELVQDVRRCLAC
jgi:hypothetical protein